MLRRYKKFQRLTRNYPRKKFKESAASIIIAELKHRGEEIKSIMIILTFFFLVQAFLLKLANFNATY